MHLTMEVDHVSGSEPEDQDWEQEIIEREARAMGKVETEATVSPKVSSTVLGNPCINEEDACSRKSGGQPESEEDGDVRGLRIVEKGAREHHTNCEVEDGTGRLGWRCMFWASED